METLTANSTYVIRQSSWQQKMFLIVKDTVAFDKLTEFFGKSYGILYGAVARLNLRATHPPCAFYYNIDEANKLTEMAAAVPVESPVPANPGVETFTLPACKVISTTHIGAYDNMKPAYDAIERYLKENNLQRTLMIEEFFSDPMLEKDASKWRTDIHFVLKG